MGEQIDLSLQFRDLTENEDWESQFEQTYVDSE